MNTKKHIFALLLAILLLGSILQATIMFTPPNPVPGQTVTFTLNPTHANMVADRQITWVWADGSQLKVPTTQLTATHVYAAAGYYEVSAQYYYYDLSGMPQYFSETILVIVIASPKSITFSPANPKSGGLVTFKALGFLAPPLRWDFGDGTVQNNLGTITTHTYSTPGSFTVRAFDNNGRDPSPAMVMVTVSSLISKVIVFSPGQPNSCEPLTFQASGFVSPTLRWDFGDGTIQAGGGQVVVHAYSSPGSFMVRAFDNNGSDANPAAKTVVVSNKRSITLLTAQAKTGIAVSFQAAGFISPCLLWDFGDGQPRVKGSAAASHVFANPGTFQVTAVDQCGESPCTAGSSVAVGSSQGPLASFTISYAILRFANGKTSLSLIQNTTGLTAFADLKFEGSGFLQVEWRVDGQPFKTATQSLGFAGQVTIDSGNIPGLPTTVLGPHTVSLAIVKPAVGFTIPTISYYVTGAPKPMYMPPSVNPLAPIIQTVIPGSLEPGKEYVLDLQGMRLTPDTVISLGTGIAVNSFTLINPMRASLSVFVSPTAKLGDHFAKASNPKGSNSGPGKIVVASPPPQPPVSMIDLACTDLSTLIVEPIELKAPAWRTYAKDAMVIEQLSDGTTLKSPAAKAGLCIPVIDDLMVLRWKSIPVYDFLEVRFFKASNNTLLMTKKISGSSQSLPLSAALINELFSHIPAATGQVYPQTQYSPGLGAQKKADMVNIPGMTPEELEEFQSKQMYDEAMKKADILWQVVGFQTLPCVYDSKKDAPSKINQSILVAQSELWMFQLPDRPNGLACPAGSGMHKGSTNINVPNISLADRNTKLPKNSELTINYVGDEFVANGFFDLARSPYGSTIIANATPSIPNLFIDWGDGTPSSTLDVQIAKSQKDRWDKSVKVEIKSTPKNHHVYLKASNQYIIRIFELSENDIQKPASGFLAKLGKALKPEESSPAPSDPGLPYHILLDKQGVPQHQSAGTGYESFPDKLGRAYMIYCRPVTIEPYRDQCNDQPISLVGIEIIDFPGHSLMIKTNGQKPPGGINLKQGQSEAYVKQGIDAVAVTCDTALNAKAELTYFGTGFVELTWRVDGKIVETRLLPKLTSEERANLSLEQAMDCSSPRLSREQKDSKPFPCKGPLPGEENSMLGTHTVTVEARVVSEYSVPNLGNVAAQAVENMLAKAGTFSNGEPAENGPYASPDPGAAASDPLLAALSKAQNSNQSMPQVGFLNPDNTADGNPAVVYLNDAALAAGEGALDSPNRVFSSAKKYQVNEVRNQLGCLVLVPDNKGEYFHLTDMDATITLDQADSTYSASGTLHIWCPTGKGSVTEALVPLVKFSKWSIADDTGIVTNGILDVSPKGVNDFQFPAFIQKAVLTRLQGGVDGKGKRPMMATLDFDLPMNGLKQISTLGKNTFASIKQATGQLAASSGDWFASDLKLDKSQFICTPFSIQSDKVTIDLSAHENPAAITKANWMGVHLGNAVITPYTMGFSPDSNQFSMHTTEEWVITSGGLNGKSKSGLFQATIAQGSFGFDSLEFSVTNNAAKGIYHNVKIFAPWLASTLTGEAKLLQKSTGSDYITELTLADHPPVTLVYSDPAQQGKLTMTASDFSFRSATVGGNAWPAVECRLVFNLECEGVPFAEFASDDFDFLFDGRALFGGKFPSKTFIPGSPSHFGLFACDLTKATVTAAADNTSNRLEIAVDSNIHYAEGGMSGYVPAANTAIHYRIFKSGKDYGLAGPVSESNDIKLDFPLASKDFGGSFQPEYTPGVAPSSSGAGSGASGPSAGDDPPSASFSGTRFSAQVPLSIFGIDIYPKIMAKFILGNQGGESYFLTVADVPLPGPGIPLAPIPFSIYNFKGGFGYHFDANTLAFADVNSQPNMNVGAAFSAGIMLGTTYDAGFTLKGSATLSMDTGGTFQADFTDWQLLTMGNFGGQLKYANKVFSGAIFGNLQLFDQFEVVKFSLGPNLANAAVKFSFGGGDWFINAGNKDKGGERITAEIWGVSANGYLMLNGTALQAGGGITTVIPPGADTWDISVYVKSYIDVGFGIYFDPFRLVGDFDQGIGVGGCLPVVGCDEFTVGARVHVEAPDPTMFKVCFKISWPKPVGKKSYCKSLKL